MATHSVTFGGAVAAWRLLRAEYDLHLEAAYAEAVEATSGVLLNAKGKAKGIDSRSLFLGTDARARCYASQELLDHWDARPRVTFAQFEAERTETPGHAWGAL